METLKFSDSELASMSVEGRVAVNLAKAKASIRKGASKEETLGIEFVPMSAVVTQDILGEDVKLPVEVFVGIVNQVFGFSTGHSYDLTNICYGIWRYGPTILPADSRLRVRRLVAALDGNQQVFAREWKVGRK